MPSSLTSQQQMLSTHMQSPQTSAQRGSAHLNYGHYSVEIRYTLTDQKLSLRGYLSCDTIGALANDYHLVLYSADGWIADFIKIQPTGRFSFSPPKKSFYSVTLRVASEEFLLGALEL